MSECKMKEIITEFPYDYQVVENDWITLKDGIKL